MTTPNLQLPEPPDFASPIAAEERDGQRALDALGPGWIAVLSATTTAPPGGSPQGARYLVPEGANGAFAGHVRHIAYLTPDGWAFRAPRRGWCALVLDQGTAGWIYTYNGTEWVRFTTDAIDLSALDAVDVAFDGYGFAGDPMTVDAALEELFGLDEDHETRIAALESQTAADIPFDGYGLPGDPLNVDAGLDELFGLEADHETRIAALESGGGGSGPALIGSDIATGAVASLSVASIPSTYSHLLIIIQARGTNAAASGTLNARFNNDSAGNYNWQQAHFVSNASGFSDGINNTEFEICDAFVDGSSTAGRASAITGFVPNYAGTTFHKNAHFMANGSFGTAAFNQVVGQQGAIWASTAAVNRIDIFPASGNLAAGSGLWVYGIP